jgi:hypothetical protein
MLEDTRIGEQHLLHLCRAETHLLLQREHLETVGDTQTHSYRKQTHPLPIYQYFGSGFNQVSGSGSGRGGGEGRAKMTRKNRKEIKKCWKFSFDG